MDHTAERIAKAAHIIRRIPSQQERERIMQQLEEDGDFTAEGIEAVRRAVGPQRCDSASSLDSLDQVRRCSLKGELLGGHL